MIQGPPPAEFQQRNLDVIRHTLFRGEELVKTDSHLELSCLSMQCQTKHPMLKFAKAWNGDYSVKCVQHYCQGCCPNGREDSVNALFSTAVEADILLAMEKQPSMDEWGSCGSAAGKLSAGILIHNLTRRVFDRALPSWSSMQPDEKKNAVRRDSVNEMRQKIQKKSFRTKRILADTDRCEDCMAIGAMQRGNTIPRWCWPRIA